jgi:hypothetical protein
MEHTGNNSEVMLEFFILNFNVKNIYIYQLNFNVKMVNDLREYKFGLNKTLPLGCIS